MKLAQVLLAVGLSGAGACTSPQPIPDTATFLGQISYVAPLDEAARGFHFVAQSDDALNDVLPQSTDVPPAKRLIAACAGEHNVDVKLVFIRFYYYQVGRSGQLYDFSHWAMVEGGLPVERGNLVEVEQRLGQGKSRCLVTTNIRAATLSTA